MAIKEKRSRERDLPAVVHKGAGRGRGERRRDREEARIRSKRRITDCIFSTRNSARAAQTRISSGDHVSDATNGGQEPLTVSLSPFLQEGAMIMEVRQHDVCREGHRREGAVYVELWRVHIVSTAHEGRMNGQIINALMQVTGNPICIAAASPGQLHDRTGAKERAVFRVRSEEERSPQVYRGFRLSLRPGVR